MGFQIQENSSRRSYSTGRRRRSTRKAVMSEINVTPFVDVMLVLLIIFMVTAPLMATGIKVDLPETNSSPISGNKKPLVISVNSKGEYFISSRKVQLSNMVKKLKAIKNANANSDIIIRGDRKVDYGSVMKAFGVLNKAGYKKVVLETTVPK